MTAIVSPVALVLVAVLWVLFLTTTTSRATRRRLGPAVGGGEEGMLRVVARRGDVLVRRSRGRRRARSGGDGRSGLEVVRGEAGGGRPGAWWTEIRRSRRQRHQDVQVVAQLPDVVDLLRLTTLAGLPVAVALSVVGDRPGGPVGRAFRQAAVRLRRGAAMADVLPRLTVWCGEPARSLVDALSDHDRYGTPLGPALDRLAIESRLKRRRQAEEAARRLPVLLLLPLVFTTLPAFLLLAIVPLVAGSLSSLGL